MTIAHTPQRRRSALAVLRNECGQAAVEFSFVLLMVIVVVFGVIEVGRLMLAYNALADAARAGARYAMVHGSWSSTPSGYGNSGSVSTQVTNITGMAGLSSVTVTVSYPNNTGGTGADPSGNQTGDSVTVTASYSYAPIITLSMFSALNVTLSSTTTGIICY